MATPYEEWMKKYGGLLPGSESAAPAATPNPYVQATGLGLDAVGKVYGAFEGQQAEEGQRKQQEAQQTHDWGRQGRQDIMAEQNNARQGAMDYGQYADKTLEELLKEYGSYNQRIGR